MMPDGGWHIHIVAALDEYTNIDPSQVESMHWSIAIRA
jgi:hypothetical protein